MSPYGYPLPQPDPDRPYRRPSGATAVVAGLLALPAAIAAGYVPIRIFLDMPAEFSLGALPGWVLADLGGFLLAGLVFLLGSVATLFRATAGAVLLLFGGLLAIAALLAEPLAAGVPLGRFVDAMFTHGGVAMIDRLVLAGLAVLVPVLAMLPPTFRHLRYRPPALHAYSGPHAFPPQRW